MALLQFFCPESARWLVQKGKIDRARKTLSIIRHPDDVETELQDIVDAITFEKSMVKPGNSYFAPCLYYSSSTGPTF
jgi:hypothetical protein